MTGSHLAIAPSQIVPFGLFAQQFSQGKVLSRNTGYSKPYGRNPYVGYESGGRTLFPVKGHRPGIPPLERLLVVSVNGKTRAYPLSLLRKSGVLEDSIEDKNFVIIRLPARSWMRRLSRSPATLVQPVCSRAS